MKTLLTLITLFITLSMNAQLTEHYTQMNTGTVNTELGTVTKTKFLIVNSTVKVDENNNVKIVIDSDVFNYPYVPNTLKIEDDKVTFEVMNPETNERLQATMDNDTFTLTVINDDNIVIFIK